MKTQHLIDAFLIAIGLIATILAVVTIVERHTPQFVFLLPRSIVPTTGSSQDPAGKMLESHWILQENTGKNWNMEAVFPPGIFRIFSDDFRSDPAGKHGKLSESTEKNPENSRPEYCFQLPSIFRCIPAVSRRTSFTWARKV